MKKRKVQLKNLSLKKSKVSNLSQSLLHGGAPNTFRCGAMSRILNCTQGNENGYNITLDREKPLCKSIFNSCKSYCPLC